MMMGTFVISKYVILLTPELCFTDYAHRWKQSQAFFDKDSWSKCQLTYELCKLVDCIQSFFVWMLLRCTIGLVQG